MSEAQNAVSTVIVNVDGEDLGIIPQSLSYKEGKPSRQVGGLDNGDILIGEDRTDAVGMIKFDLPTTKENIERAKTLRERKASTVSFYDDSGTEQVMQTGVTMNSDDNTVGKDGKITLDYQGTPLQ